MPVEPSGVSLINQLPPEILAEIFLLVPSKGIQLVLRSPCPWNLALVCKLWRDVTFSTPQLWSDVTVQLDPIRMSRLDIRSDAIAAAWELCLRRSGDCPLTVTFDASSSTTMAFIPSLLEPLMDHVERWDTIIFGFPIDILLSFVLNSDIQYPRLRRLTFRGKEGTTTDEHPPLTQFFRNAPLLSRLSFHEFCYPPLALKFPWSQITELATYMNPGLSIYHLLDSLKYMPDLSNLTFYQIIDSSPPFLPATQPHEVVQLPHLRKLSWQTYMSNDTPFFDLICTPRLSEIGFGCPDESWDPDLMLRFLRRSNCTILSLKVHQTSPHVTSSFLALLPDIEIVTLASIVVDEELIRALTSLAPKLKTLVLQNITVKKECHEAFVEMFRLRIRTPSSVGGPERKLESLRIETSLYPGESVYKSEVYNVLRQSLSPEEMISVTTKTSIMGEEL